MLEKVLLCGGVEEPSWDRFITQRRGTGPKDGAPRDPTEPARGLVHATPTRASRESEAVPRLPGCSQTRFQIQNGHIKVFDWG